MSMVPGTCRLGNFEKHPVFCLLKTQVTCSPDTPAEKFADPHLNGYIWYPIPSCPLRQVYLTVGIFNK